MATQLYDPETGTRSKTFSPDSESWYVFKVYPKGTPDETIEADFEGERYDGPGRRFIHNVWITRRGSRVLALQLHGFDI